MRWLNLNRVCRKCEYWHFQHILRLQQHQDLHLFFQEVFCGKSFAWLFVYRWLSKFYFCSHNLLPLKHFAVSRWQKYLIFRKTFSHFNEFWQPMLSTCQECAHCSDSSTCFSLIPKRESGKLYLIKRRCGKGGRELWSMLVVERSTYLFIEVTYRLLFF